MRSRPSALLRGTIALLVYSLAALVYLRPIWESYADHLTPDAGDPLFNLYILKWVGHQARTGFAGLWDAPFFFPTRGALALSDHLIGPGLAIAWLGNPVAGYNLLLAASFVLSGLAAWWVLQASGRSFAAALLGGAMFAFAPYRWSQLSHVQILLAQGVPLTLWAWDRLLAERTARRAALFLAIYSLHVLGGCYLAYMIHVPLLILLASRWAAEGRALGSPRSLRVLLPTALAALALVAAIFLPYRTAARSLSLSHGEGEVVRNGAALASYLSPAPQSWYSMLPARALARRSQLERWRQPFVRTENALFPGFLASLLGALGIGAFWRRYRRPAAPLPPRRRAVLLALALLAAALYALGDVYTLGLDHDTFLGPWLPWATSGLWNALGGAFLAALGAWLWLRHRWGAGALRWREMDPWERGLAISGIACFLLSHPLVYLPLMRVVPGMSGMRVPARFATLVLWSVVFFAARGLDGLLARISKGGRRPALRAAALAALAALLAVELAPRPLSWVYVPQESGFPEVYRWLAAQPDVGALLDVPLRRNTRETRPMYYSTAGWRPLVNGFSGFVPPSHDELADRIGWLPDGGGLDLLESLGVTHLVVRTPTAAGVREWERGLAGRADLVHEAEGDRVYRLRKAPPRPAPGSGPQAPSGA
jgi:hypothetical protein